MTKATVTATVTQASATRVITSDKDDKIPTVAEAATDNAPLTANQVDLAVGANVIRIKVDAADAMATKTYTVTVTRATATASTDANLSSLNLSRVTLSPAFDPWKNIVHRQGAELRERDDR